MKRDDNMDTGDLRQHIVKDVTVAEYIVQCLVDCGVTHVFGGHGGG